MSNIQDNNEQDTEVTSDQIEAAVKEWLELTEVNPDTTLEVRGYVSSTGSVTDYDLRYVGPDGYINLVMESVAALDNVFHDEEHDKEVWETAKSEIKESLLKTLRGEQPQRSYGDRAGPGTVCIFHMVATSVYQHQPGKEVKSKPLTLAKESVRLQLPIGAYVGKLILAPEKVRAVKVRKRPISDRKFFKTVFKVTVLSEEPYSTVRDLQNIAWDIANGGCSGVVDCVSECVLDAAQAAKELMAQASDPEFFRIDEDGCDVQ